MSIGSTAAGPASEGIILAGFGLSKSYGDLLVLSGVDFSVGHGEAVGIVGPNGAGKTTLLNVLAGSAMPEAGTIRLDGQEITGMRPHQRCRKGIARTFQIPRPFGGLTVLENVLVGGAAAHDRCVEVLELCGLLDVANRRAESLGLLHRKRLELARALATNPRVLLLDEIGGGLTDAEAAELVTTIQQLRALGLAVVWIEHIVHVLLQVVDRLVGMDGGRVIADGEPTAVLRDAVVIDAYLGKAGA